MSDDKVVKLTNNASMKGDVAGVANRLREVADEFERGEWGDITTVLMLVESSQDGGRLDRLTLTTRERIDSARVAGLLAFAQHQVLCPRD